MLSSLNKDIIIIIIISKDQDGPMHLTGIEIFDCFSIKQKIACSEEPNAEVYLLSISVSVLWSSPYDHCVRAPLAQLVECRTL